MLCYASWKRKKTEVSRRVYTKVVGEKEREAMPEQKKNDKKLFNFEDALEDLLAI